MIWSIVITLIPVFILVFIVLHFSEIVWIYFFSNETSQENNGGLSTSGNEEKREDIFTSSLSGYCDDFQASLNLQNQRDENETLHSNDFETVINRNLDSQSVLNQQDKTIQSRPFTSGEFFSANTERCHADSQLVSNQKEGGKKINAVPRLDILKENQKGINCYRSRLETIQPDEKSNQNKSLDESCSNYQIQSKQQNNGKENKPLMSKDVHNNNNGGYLNTSQTVSTPRDLEKDKSLQSKDILSKILEVNCSNSLSLAKQQDERKEDQILPYKSIHKTNTEGQKVILGECSSSDLDTYSQIASGEQDYKRETELQSKVIENKNVEGNSPNSQLLSPQQKDEKRDKALLSENIEKNNIGGHLTTSLTFFAQQDEEKDKAVESKHIQNKNLQGSSPNSLSQSKQQDDGMEDESLPSKDVNNKSSEGYLNETETISNQNRDGMEDIDLPVKCTHNRNPSRIFFNSELVSKRQKEKIRRRTFTSKIIDYQKGVGSFMCVLFDNQLYTDVTFISKGNKALLSAHRAVLAAKCEYFKDLLFGDLANKSYGMRMDLEINNVPFCIFSSIIRWFYTENIEFSDVYTVLEIYQAAKHFKIQQLIDECRSYIESMEITEHNLLSNLQLSNTLQVNELKRRCVKYIEQNTLSVINSTEFEKSPLHIVREICQLQCLSLQSEAELLEALLRWLNAQPKLKKNAMQELKRSLLKCVRFLSFSAKEFSDVISKNEALLTTEERLKILLYLNNPTPDGLEALPKWCNKNQRILLSNQERKDKGIEENLVSEDSELGKIKIKLKPPDDEQDFSELTSVLHMRCKKGMHQISSVKFSFQTVENNRGVFADLKIIVNVHPNGPKFLKFYTIRQSEITFDFTKAVTVHEGQVLMMEVTANTRHSCNFFQFDKWFNDSKRDFDCFFISKPPVGKSYFISEVTYEPLATRFNSPH